ncbi:MAG: hypothetical protein J4F31_04435 [Flavobacteriales bacterium]|nr:hypothetical protein [Flavobacteriales bacterium]
MSLPHGYAMMPRDINGDRVQAIHLNEGVGNRVLMRGICKNSSGEVVVVGQVHGDFVAEKWSSDLSTRVTRKRIDYIGVGSGINGNSAFIEPIPTGGYFTAHMNAPQTVVINRLDEDLEVIDRWEPDFTESQEYPSDMRLLSNGDLLLKTFRLDANINTDSRLYRASPKGELIWSRTFDGTNGRVAIWDDAYWIITENPKHDELLVKSRIHKINSDGAN